MDSDLVVEESLYFKESKKKRKSKKAEGDDDSENEVILCSLSHNVQPPLSRRSRRF